MKQKHLSNLFSAICLLCLSTAALPQTQLGTDIDGKAGDGLGNHLSLSSDGNRLAVGVLYSDVNAEDSGHVAVYQWSGEAWEKLGADINGEGAGDLCNVTAISSDGNRLAVGSWLNDGNGSYSGHVRIYQWSGSAWEQLGADIDGEAAGDQSGWSISLSSNGDQLAIGASGNDGNGDRSGHVRVYQWSGTAWTQIGADIDGEAAGDESGRSVSLSSDGNRVAIGARANDGNGSNSGHVRIYQWSGSAWEQLGADIDGEVAGDESGWSISLSSDGNRVAIGAVANDGNGDDSGHVRVYQWSDTAWEQLGIDIDGETAADLSGISVSLSASGNRLAIGAESNDDNAANAGQVRIYQWSGMVWEQLGIDIDGEGVNDRAVVISLSSDGNRVAIGSKAHDDDRGHVRIFDLSMFNVFKINPGLNDAWYNRATSGQGFLLTVLPNIEQMFLAWFTFDTQRPPEDATAFLGEPGHRWLTAQGPYNGDTAELTIYVTKGGVFDAIEPTASADQAGDGTLTIEFADCNAGLVSYEITSLGISGEIPIQRLSLDNVPLCESLGAQ